jgi:hypothetical protein
VECDDLSWMLADNHPLPGSPSTCRGTLQTSIFYIFFDNVDELLLSRTVEYSVQYEYIALFMFQSSFRQVKERIQ